MIRLKGRVKIAVREGARIVHSYPWQENLILDQGLDKVATVLYNQLFAACAIGTGTNPTGRDPATTATLSGQNLTATAGDFTNADLDSDVVFDGGARYKLQSVTDNNHVTVFTSGTVSPATHYVIQATNQAILGNEVKRTITCLGTPGACGANVSQGSITLFRTFAFAPETTNITYTEVGFSDQSTAGANLFSRILLGQPVSLLGPSAQVPGGQQLQVMYQLQIAFDYGQGQGNYFTGVNRGTIAITNLPIQFSVWQYAPSLNFPSNLAVTVTGVVPANVGAQLTISGSSVTAYNGLWTVLDVQQVNDPTHGFSTILSVNVTYQSAASPTGGTVTMPLTGFWFRACQGIYLVGSFGQSLAPAPTPDSFLGYGEPSIAGQAWLSSVGPTYMGSNGAPAAIPVTDPPLVVTAPCTALSYTNGSFYLDKVVDLVVGATQENISSFGLGLPDNTNQIMSWCWDQPHPLAPGSTLALTFRTSWSR